MFAVANTELGKEVKKGDLVKSKTGYIVRLEYGQDENGNETNILGFISIESGDYLVAVRDKLIPGCRKMRDE